MQRCGRSKDNTVVRSGPVQILGIHTIYRMMFAITYSKKKTTDYIWQQTNDLAGRPDILLSNMISRRTLSWFDRVCPHDTLPKTVRHTERRKVAVAQEDCSSHEATTPGSGRQKPIGTPHHLGSVCVLGTVFSSSCGRDQPTPTGL